MAALLFHGESGCFSAYYRNDTCFNPFETVAVTFVPIQVDERQFLVPGRDPGRAFSQLPLLPLLRPTFLT